MYPKSFDNLISIFEKLPGVGNKTAQRYAFSLLEKSDDEVNEIVQNILTIKNIKKWIKKL